jgi:hypothetical protein
MKTIASGRLRFRRAGQGFRAVALCVVLPSMLFLGSSLRARQAGGGNDYVHWKQVPDAQVKLDDKTPLAWNVFQPDKKDRKDKKTTVDRILVLLGHRYLMLDTKSRVVYSVPLVAIHAQGADFDSEDLAQESLRVPSSDWSIRDVGPAEWVQLTLGDYGRTLIVILPHPPDLRPFY